MQAGARCGFSWIAHIYDKDHWDPSPIRWAVRTKGKRDIIWGHALKNTKDTQIRTFSAFTRETKVRNINGDVRVLRTRLSQVHKGLLWDIINPTILKQIMFISKCYGHTSRDHWFSESTDVQLVYRFTRPQVQGRTWILCTGWVRCVKQDYFLNNSLMLACVQVNGELLLTDSVTLCWVVGRAP